MAAQSTKNLIGRLMSGSIPRRAGRGRVVAFSREDRHNRTMMERRVRETIERYGMIPRGSRVLAAVSGGLDSVTLVSILHRLAEELGFSIVVAHLDHALRSGSAADAAFVVDLGGRMGLPVVAERIDVGALAQSERIGIEEAAREARHDFLDRAAREAAAERVALGHTADDQAETILFRLARGTGLEGLRGMDAMSGKLIRPLLHVTRADVRRYAEAQGLSWREDPSNVDLRFSRNRIRQHVLPELRTINPEAAGALQRTGRLAGEALDALGYLVSSLWPALGASVEPGRVEWSRDAFTRLPESVQAFVLREAIRRARGTLRGIARAHIVAARLLIAQPAATAALDLPQARVAVSGDRVLLRGEVPAAEPASSWSTALSLGRTVLPELRLTIELSVESLARRGEVPEADEGTELADADRVAFPLTLRTRQEGDRFAPLGMGHDIRLKDFFINQRIPRAARDRLPLLCDQEKVIWVVGVRLSERVKVNRSTTRVLRMRVARSEG
ncbi:MAG: tRNA lysidine(34) synthetase TilS [Candidatus Bipolaricaulis sp.]|nr:tRNA lysidine(34) synthetase TilS [Candidatus Bipolaricaulis sp.]